MTIAYSALDDRIAMVAACTTLGMPAGSRSRDDVLTNQEWNQVAQWLLKQQKRPGDLLLLQASDLATGGLDTQLAFKAASIADRASVAALEMEQLDRVGIWTLSRTDDDYPQRWKNRLKSVAPPVIFGTGPCELLDHESIAIVGSREITAELSEIAESIGLRAARAGFTVVSGGARGSDRVGMWGALQDEGSAVGVLPADLAGLSRRREVREFIAADRLCLVSHVNPAAGFAVGNAMSRNRLIYALADLTIVISTSEGSGGTWAGAIENLKRRWAPIAVWSGADAPDANSALVARGAFPLSIRPESTDEFREVVTVAIEHFAMADSPPAGTPAVQPALFDPR